MEAQGAAWPPDERPHYERVVATVTTAMGSVKFERVRAPQGTRWTRGRQSTSPSEPTRPAHPRSRHRDADGGK